MDPNVLWLLVAIGIIAVIGLVWLALSRRRTRELRTRFGSEYDHALDSEGSARRAEAALEARARRVEALQIRLLTLDQAERFGASWRAVQARFVDDPSGAVSEADRLVGEVMTARGYPIGEFEQRVADISVDHPDVVINYRAAREIALQHARGEASTEDLRQAMVHYRALFDDLLETTTTHVEERVAHDVQGRR